MWKLCMGLLFIIIVNDGMDLVSQHNPKIEKENSLIVQGLLSLWTR